MTLKSHNGNSPCCSLVRICPTYNEEQNLQRKRTFASGDLVVACTWLRLVNKTYCVINYISVQVIRYVLITKLVGLREKYMKGVSEKKQTTSFKIRQEVRTFESI